MPRKAPAQPKPRPFPDPDSLCASCRVFDGAVHSCGRLRLHVALLGLERSREINDCSGYLPIPPQETTT